MEAISQLIEDIGHKTTMKLMAAFKDDADKRIGAMREILTTDGDLQDLRIQAHSLKGLCLTYGAAQAGDVAMQLQQACDTGDDAQIRAKAQMALEVIPADVDATIAAARALA